MHRLTLALVLLPVATLVLASPARATTMSYLDDGVVTVGVDLDRGGMIVYLAPSGAAPSANLVDATTLGDGIQPWFQAGDAPFANPAPPYESNPWNPSVGGDAYGHPSWLDPSSSSNDGTTIHTVTSPEQWALNNEGCDCRIEQWIALDGAAVHLRVELTFSSWSSAVLGQALRDQALPALHLAAKLDRLLAYTGDAPFSGGALTELAAGARNSVTASETWTALVDAGGAGVGVIHPDVTRFDFARGFLAPVATANIMRGTTYQDESTIVLGTAAQVRAYAAAHHPDPRPDYRFTATDDRHWTRWNAQLPPTGTSVLTLVPTRSDPQLLGPDEWFQTGDVPVLYVRGAWHTHDTLAQLFWRAPGTPFAEQRSVRFRVVDDGRMHTYAVPLSGQPLYSGTVAQLRFDPVCCSESDSLVELASISWRPETDAVPVAIEHARRLDVRIVRDRKHRVGLLGRLSVEDPYLSCIAGVPIRVERLLLGSWVPVKTLFTGTGGQFSLALPRKTRSRYRAIAGLIAQRGNTCASISATA
jgi:hypothetical protein